MPNVTFADVVHPSLSFSPDIPSQSLILKLIDTSWVQRLRDISQTANTRLVYMFSEHSRFGHSLGVAYLAEILMDNLSVAYRDQIEPYRNSVSAAAILHDIGHLAPGAHTAFKSWFPTCKDKHEELGIKILSENDEMLTILHSFGSDVAKTTAAILEESPELPPWCWQIISGGGWNVDRGNWCIVDSILAGVSYGRYNIPALTDSIVITKQGELALRENRLDAMMHFAVSRHAMYRQIYQHRVILAADTINHAIISRARDTIDNLPFADDQMRNALSAKVPEDLSTDDIFHMRESWWRYHLIRWTTGKDKILADLCSRLLNRKLFKTVRVTELDNTDALLKEAKSAVEKAGFDPKYYLHQVSTVDMHASDLEQSMPVLFEDGSVKKIFDADPLFNTLLRENKQGQRRWLVLPAEAKELLGRVR